MSNAGLDAAIEAAGGRTVRTPVGDKHVIDAMLQHGYNFGGEQSGHLIFGDHASTGDGLVAALQILRIMAAKQQPFQAGPVLDAFPAKAYQPTRDGEETH